MNIRYSEGVIRPSSIEFLQLWLQQCAQREARGGGTDFPSRSDDLVRVIGQPRAYHVDVDLIKFQKFHQAQKTQLVSYTWLSVCTSEEAEDGPFPPFCTTLIQAKSQFSIPSGQETNSAEGDARTAPFSVWPMFPLRVLDLEAGVSTAPSDAKSVSSTPIEVKQVDWVDNSHGQTKGPRYNARKARERRLRLSCILCLPRLIYNSQHSLPTLMFVNDLLSCILIDKPPT